MRLFWDVWASVCAQQLCTDETQHLGLSPGYHCITRVTGHHCDPLIIVAKNTASMCWPLNTQRSSSGFSNRLVLSPHRLQAITRTAPEAHINQLKDIPTDSNEKCRTTCALIPFVAVSVECLSSGLVCFISHRLSFLISSRKIGCIREYWSRLMSFFDRVTHTGSISDN